MVFKLNYFGILDSALSSSVSTRSRTALPSAHWANDLLIVQISYCAASKMLNWGNDDFRCLLHFVTKWQHFVFILGGWGGCDWGAPLSQMLYGVAPTLAVQWRCSSSSSGGESGDWTDPVPPGGYYRHSHSASALTPPIPCLLMYMAMADSLLPDVTVDS